MTEPAVEHDGDPDTTVEGSVHVDYQLSGADYRSATIELAQQSMITVAAGTFLVGIGVVGFLIGDLVSIVTIAFGASLLTGVYCLPFIWWAIRRRSDLLLSHHDFTADATGIRVATATTTTQQTWATFRRVRELTAVFTLDYGTGANAMVPKRALDPASEARFRKLVGSLGLLQTPSRWANFARGVGLGILAALALTVGSMILASGGG